MTTQEFSNEFDILLNSYSNTFGEPLSKTDIVLDEYEKSVLLTQAQEEIVRGLYNGTLAGQSFERTEELRRYLDGLVKTAALEPSTTTGFSKIDVNKSTFFELPDDVWFITYEQAIISNRAIKVIPMRQDEWHKNKNNPFKMPNENKVIRLDYGNGVIELIPHVPSITAYIIKYVSKPFPIILIDLPEGLKINGESIATNCKLNTALHRVILERAVQLAYKRIPQASK